MLNPLVRIVDDDEELLNSTSFFLQMAGWEVKTYSSALDFLEQDDIERPGCLVLDVRMPGMTGNELQSEMIAQGIHLPIIFLSAHGELSMAVHALKKGANDFLEKPVKPEVLQNAVRKAMDKSISEHQMEQKQRSLRSKFRTLTTRELEVAHLVVKGMTNKEVGEQLGISLPTVKMHRGNLCEKLGVKSAVEVADIFREIGEL